MFIWYIFAVFLLAVLICELYAVRTGVPTVTSVPSVRKKMIELLCADAARHTKEQPFTVLDLGSGTGKLTLEISHALPQAKIIGIELSWIPYYLSLARRALWRVKNVTYRCEDFWKADISNIHAVTIYMTHKIQIRMAEKLKELPDGALILINETHLPGWTPLEIHKVGFMKVAVVVYRKNPPTS